MHYNMTTSQDCDTDGLQSDTIFSLYLVNLFNKSFRKHWDNAIRMAGVKYIQYNTTCSGFNRYSRTLSFQQRVWLGVPVFFYLKANLLVVGTYCIVPTHTWAWWRHQMEKFSALLTVYSGNPPVTDEFPSQGPVTRSFDISLICALNKRLSKQSGSWWFETPSRSLWRHCYYHQSSYNTLINTI